VTEHTNTPTITLTQAVIGGIVVQAIDGRELHAYLQVGKDFSNWMKARITAYGFEEGRDFLTTGGLSSPISASAKARSQKTVEYTITIDMAKELAMVERNDRGKEARRYFIECERRAQALGGERPLPFDQFGTEELNARIGAVRQATRLWGRAAGSWVWQAADLPMPPQRLLPAWAQHEMDLRAPQQIVTVTISQQPGGSNAK
jgi:phage anti-repressor protein